VQKFILVVNSQSAPWEKSHSEFWRACKCVRLSPTLLSYFYTVSLFHLERLEPARQSKLKTIYGYFADVTLSVSKSALQQTVVFFYYFSLSLQAVFLFLQYSVFKTSR
jgi:hypothetical protein